MTNMAWLRRLGRNVTDAAEFDYPFDDLLPAAGRRAETRADCCVATAAMQVILPASPGRPRPATLLLCRHHFRAHRTALGRLNAAAFDMRERLCAVDR